MNSSDQLKKQLSDIVSMAAAPLSELGITTILESNLEEYLARLSFHVAPSYLPFATDDLGVYAVHTWPDREILSSPIVHVPTDAQDARFLCDSLRTLPAAIWLWVSAYFEDRPEKLRHATDQLAQQIPGSQSVSQDLWDYLKDEPVRWSPTNQRSNEAWLRARVGHPFAGMPVFKFLTDVSDALPLLEPFVLSRRNEPQVLAMYLATLAKAGKPRPREDILTVLSAEAWRNLECIPGYWREDGRGICEWDCTLKITEDPEATFRGTPFEPLRGHPDTYSGEDKEGPKRLLAVADNFHKANDPAGELRQTRNAATLAILTAGEYPLDYAERIASACDAIEKDSLAAAIARESARVHSQGP